MTVYKPSDSNEKALSQGPTYFEKFGERVPTNVGKFAANTGQGREFSKMISEQIRKGEPVKDWEEFAKPLLERWEARH